MPGMLGTVKCYLIQHNGRNVLVDTGMANAATMIALEKRLGEFGTSVGCIEKVVCTHFHPDHCGLARWFQQHGIPVLVSHREAEVLHGYFSSTNMDVERAAFYYQHGIPPHFSETVLPIFSFLRSLHQDFEPDGVLEDGQYVDLAGVSFQVLCTPGHTDGHMCLVQHEEEFVLLGDHVLNHSAVNISLQQESSHASPLAVYLEAVRRIKELGDFKGYPAHGSIIAHVALRCEALDAMHLQRIERVFAGLETQPCGALELGERVFGQKRRTFSKWLCTAQVISYLEYLEVAQRVRMEKTGNKNIYSTV